MQALLEAMRQANYIVVFSGAGMDTESQLPDFRGKGGLWRDHDPRALASTDALANNYELFREFYQHRMQALDAATPHRGHDILARWEETGVLKSIITQNVSGLHAAAGSKRVIELHGNIRQVFCDLCGESVAPEEFFQGQRCGCGGKLRPGVVLFGESLPQTAFQGALKELEQADLLLILGTSLAVFPAAELPFVYPMQRAYVDLAAGADPRLDFIFRQPIGQFLEQLDQKMQQ